ncbi:MAG: TetR/AcrR family transcriptional regulator [Cyanobacteria bacterium J06638_6]
MARPKTFDPSMALEQAMAVFWLKGYEATSMQDLVVAMGINRASLYATFEDKRQLFLDAIAHYNDTVVRPAIAPLEAPGAAKAEILQHFQRSATSGSGSQRGCLMTNAIVECAPHDPVLATQLRRLMQTVEDGFYAALVRARDQGEIGSDRDLRALARYFVASLQGLRVMARSGASPETLQDVATTIVSVLDC